uniref:CSON005622 protein n=1 Tax=Culicoides sonorensis TaxID=179676 RepID=A0A336LZ28_CULSO
MSYGLPQGRNMLYGYQKFGRLDSIAGRTLPEAYRKFWNEWKVQEPTAVHYIPKEGKYKRDPETGLVTPIQNVKIPLLFPEEAQNQIWGGEGVVKGFQKRSPYKHRVPHFWVPVLRRSIVHSTILNQYLSVVITDRALALIHESLGFDHYLLKTPACDLKQLLPLRLKRQLLIALLNGCPDLKDNPTKQQEVMSEYKKYLDQYTPEEIDWYGLSYNEALEKLQAQELAENKPIPYKYIFRQKLIEQLKEAGVAEAQDDDEKSSGAWMSKLNPFSKTKKPEV